MFHVKRPGLSPNIRTERRTKGPDCWRRGRAGVCMVIAMAHLLQAPSPAVRCNLADSAKLITEQSPTAETSTVSRESTWESVVQPNHSRYAPIRPIQFVLDIQRTGQKTPAGSGFT